MLAHRDDFDVNTIERMEGHFQKEFGHNFKIQFAGDLTPNDPLYKRVHAIAEILAVKLKRSLEEGYCTDCENQGVTILWTEIADDSGNVVGYKCPYC